MTLPKAGSGELSFDPPPIDSVAPTPPAARPKRRPRHSVIMLVDMDAFFASVEQSQHAHLRGRPVIVCGDPDRRGVVTAASYEARPSGVHAGMPLQEARRLCPDAEYVEGNPDKYVSISLQLLDLYTRYSPDVEPFSVDEAFIGFGHRLSLDQGLDLARRIQVEIAKRFELGASIGVGPNKLVAKMAAGVEKPRGLTALDEAGFRDTFWPLDVRKMWGVGEKLSDRMRSLGIMTVGDLARAPAPALSGAFGVIGPQLREAAWGRDETPLVPCYEGVDPKSMGHEVTLGEDSDDAEHLEATLLRLCDQVARRLRKEGFVGRVVAVRLRDHQFVTRIRQRAVHAHTQEPARIFEVARALFRENWSGGALRLVGVTVSALEPAPDGEQTDLFAVGERAEKLNRALDQVRDKLGEVAVVPAATLRQKRRSSHVPFGAVSPRTIRPRSRD
jgi:DNA polymerase-4